MFPIGPTIPGSANFSSIVSGTVNMPVISNQNDINILTVNGTVKMTIGTNIYVWPTSPPPGYNYVLGINNIQTVDEITTYTLGWVIGYICFHVSTKVRLENNTTVTLDKLKYGDKVLAMNKNMDLIYSPIVDFTGVFPNKAGAYIKIHHTNGDSLILSGIHLVYVDSKFMLAQELVKGMKLTFIRNGEILMSEITHIENGFDHGWYSPLTKCGTIFVNDVLASCHTTNEHKIARIFYKPLHIYLYFFPKKIGELPKERYHWYSQGFKRSCVGIAILKFLGCIF
jgi:hypothetical protein